MTVVHPSRSTHPLAEVRAGDVMCPGLITVPPRAPLPAVARAMAVNEVHAVLVPRGTAPHGAVPRVLTDLDLVRWAVSDAPDDAVAADVAGDAPWTMRPGETLDHAVRTMTELREEHVLVTEEDGSPAGVVSSVDVIAVLGGRRPRAARLVRPVAARPAHSDARLDHVGVCDAMHSGIVSCAPDTALPAIAASMADHRIHAVAVAGVTGERLVWGIVPSMSLLDAARAGRLDALAADLATERPAVIDEGDTLLDAARVMTGRRVHHAVVVVTARGGVPVGVVSTLDVAAVCGIR
jgi:CBS domain-containing protein